MCPSTTQKKMDAFETERGESEKKKIDTRCYILPICTRAHCNMAVLESSVVCKQTKSARTICVIIYFFFDPHYEECTLYTYIYIFIYRKYRKKEKKTSPILTPKYKLNKKFFFPTLDFPKRYQKDFAIFRWAPV